LWWVDKLGENSRRDADTKERLESAGWAVLVVWAHEDVPSAADRIERTIRDRRASTESVSRLVR
jgi:DNA mismatch endonuclease (patch repair protein)